MDGDRSVSAESDVLTPQQAPREPRALRRRPVEARPRTLLWLVIMTILIALVLGSLYAFNRFRQQAIANFFAHYKPPPAAVSAVVARLQSVPRYAAGIGSLKAVHQVMVTPELGGRVTKILFHSGAAAKAGELLVQLDDAPDRADLENYKAQARLAAITLERSSRLVGRGFTPRQTVDQDRAALAEAEAEIQKTEAIIAEKAIRAPFSGKLGIRQINLGQYLSPGTPIVTLTDLRTLYVDFTLPSRMRPEIAVAERVDVTADAFPRRVFHAVITAIEPQVSPETRTLEVEARISNPGGLLLPGLFVNAAVVLPPRPDTVVLPQTAVTYTLYGDSVYVIRRSGSDRDGKRVRRAFRTPVKTGREWGNEVAILSGLKAGEEVVAAGQIKLHNGAAVTVTGAPPPQPPAHPSLH